MGRRLLAEVLPVLPKVLLSAWREAIALSNQPRGEGREACFGAHQGHDRELCLSKTSLSACWSGRAARAFSLRLSVWDASRFVRTSASLIEHVAAM